MKGEFLNKHKFSVLVITLAFSAILGLATFTGLDYYKTAKDIRAKEQETADKLAAAQQKAWAEKAALRKKTTTARSLLLTKSTASSQKLGSQMIWRLSKRGYPCAKKPLPNTTP